MSAHPWDVGFEVKEEHDALGDEKAEEHDEEAWARDLYAVCNRNTKSIHNVHGQAFPEKCYSNCNVSFR